jgi:hypothetical protein
MICKPLLAATLLVGCLGAGYVLADDNAAPVDLAECEALAQMTPMDIFSKTQNGVSQDYQQMAVGCFKSNACASLTDVDKPSCARSIALNSYLIDVAYKTHGVAYPPYPNVKSAPKQASQAPNTTAATTQPALDNLAAPSVEAQSPTNKSNQQTEAINWS